LEYPREIGAEASAMTLSRRRYLPEGMKRYAWHYDKIRLDPLCQDLLSTRSSELVCGDFNGLLLAQNPISNHERKFPVRPPSYSEHLQSIEHHFSGWWSGSSREDHDYPG
jgi:hypothetical protein